jgi:hypothetical protein
MSPNATKIEAMVNVENTTAVAAKRTRVMASQRIVPLKSSATKKRGERHIDSEVYTLYSPTPYGAQVAAFSTANLFPMVSLATSG